MTGKRLVQGCYAVAWAGVEPTAFELQGRTPLSHGVALACFGKTDRNILEIFSFVLGRRKHAASFVFLSNGLLALTCFVVLVRPN